MALYRCIAKKTSETSLTPSNASPAAISSGGVYQATAAGYAISSYSSMGSSSRPNWLESGDILQSTGDVLALGEDNYGGSIVPLNSNPQSLVDGKICLVYGNGYAIESYSSVTPSNSSPANLLSGYIYKMNSGGKAVASLATLSPSNSDPIALMGSTPYIGNGSTSDLIGYAIRNYESKTPTAVAALVLLAGGIYKIDGSSPGYLIKDYFVLTPSDSNPPAVAPDIFVQPSANGYLVSGILQDKIKTTGASGMWVSDLYVRKAAVPNPAGSSTESKSWTSDGHYYLVWNMNGGNTGTSYSVKKNGTSISTSSGRGGVEVVAGDVIAMSVKAANSSTQAIRYHNIQAFAIPLDP